MKAWLLFAMAMGVNLAGRAHAGPWSIEPRIGISADYATNPLLREFGGTSEEHVAGLADLPVHFDDDAIELLLRPNVRLSNSAGYSSLASDYEHFDADAKYSTERGSLSLVSNIYRDSSLYYAGALANGFGVRRDSTTSSLDWTRLLTERIQLQLDVSWSRVLYDKPISFDYLVNYRYLTAGPTFAFAVTERDTVQLLANVGQFDSINGITASRSENLQLGYVRQLDEKWTLNADAGYSKSIDSEKIFFGPFYLGTLSSTQYGAVYSASINRKGETLTVSAGVSRALQPTGFAYLSRQDTYSLNLTDSYSERLDFALAAAWQKGLNPVPTVGGRVLAGYEADVRFLNVQFTANWHWTPQWTVAMHATRISQEFGPPSVSGASSGVSVDLTRQFLRREL